MKSPARLALAGLASVVLLAGCNSDDRKAKGAAEDDPAVAGALGDQIMVDPELAGQNQGSSAVSADLGKIQLPPERMTPEAVAAAKAQAAKLAGGSLQSAPAPSGGDVASLVEGAATAAQVAEAARAGKVDCSQKVQHSANWVNSLPAVLSVYPQAAVQEAAGTDSEGCRLRVVSFITPVATGDVIDFYYTRVRAGGYDAKYRVDGNDHVLGGNKGSAAYLVYARKLDNGLTEVDLISSGS